MFEIGRLCVKIAGREAGKKCVVVDTIDDNYVLLDGQVRRKKCNIMHLEPLKDVLKIKKNESHEEIKKEFQKLGIMVLDTKPKKAGPRPRTVRKSALKEQASEGKKTAKKPVKAAKLADEPKDAEFKEVKAESKEQPKKDKKKEKPVKKEKKSKNK